MSLSIEQLRELLNQHYQDCYDSAERLFSDLEPEDITRLCIMRLKDYEEAKADRNSPNEMSEDEALDSLLDSEEAKAVFEAAKAITEAIMGKTPSSVN